MITAGVRGVGAGQAELVPDLGASADNDEQLSWVLGTACTVMEAYWELAAFDAHAASAILRPVYEISQGADGFVSVPMMRADDYWEAMDSIRKIVDAGDVLNNLQDESVPLT